MPLHNILYRLEEQLIIDLVKKHLDYSITHTHTTLERILLDESCKP